MKHSSSSWIILIALSLVWGSSFILMKEGMKAFSSDEVAALRISIAFVSLAPFLIKQFAGIQWKKNWKGLIRRPSNCRSFRAMTRYSTLQ